MNMNVNFLRANQTYVVEQKRRKSATIGKRVECYDNTFISNLDVSTPFPVAEVIVCAFIEDILLKENQNQIEDEAGKGWEYCNLQIAENEITGKLSFSVRLAAATTASVYAAEIEFYNQSYADGSKLPILGFDGNLSQIEDCIEDSCFLCAHAQQLEIEIEEDSDEESKSSEEENN